MSQALEVIDVPTIRPPGVTKRQWRLAALLPRCITAAEAMRQAGYAPQTIDKMSRPILGTIGVKRAIEAQQKSKADSARGLLGVGNAALASVAADLQQLEPRDRIGVGLKATELAHQIGENIEQTGSSEAWKQRQRRAIRLAYRFGMNAARRTRDVVEAVATSETQSE